MANALRREGGRSSAPGVFSASETLAGITGPGRRPVTTLQLRRFGPGEDLSVLADFPDLERLEFHHVNRVDLSPLAGLGLTALVIKNASGLDLAPVNELPALEWLGLSEIDHMAIPPLVLPPTLRTLAVVNGDPMLTGEPVKQVIEAVQWDCLGGLRALGLRVGGVHEMEPIQVDLGLLWHLQELEHLELHAGVHHAGPGPSPLEPPFDGLSKRLSFVRIDSWDPEPVRVALRTYLGMYSGSESALSVDQRLGVEPSTIESQDEDWIEDESDSGGAYAEAETEADGPFAEHEPQHGDQPAGAAPDAWHPRHEVVRDAWHPRHEVVRDAWHPRHDAGPELLPPPEPDPDSDGREDQLPPLPQRHRHAADPF